MLRRAFSFQRHGYSDAAAGARLDLVYVTPQLLAASMPTTTYLKSWYHTPASELKEFLDRNHADHWHIWNLQEDCELSYDPQADFDGKVTRHPARDHAPLPFLEILAIAVEIKHYLEEDHRNVALIHCKQGKGRTGTVVVSYLQLYHGMSLDQAMASFTSRRMRCGFGSGVSIKSQQRYLQYVSQYVISPQPLSRPQSLELRGIVFRNLTYNEFQLEAFNLSDSDDVQTTWDIVRKPPPANSSDASSVCIYRPVGNIVAWQPDLVINITANVALGSLHIPHSTASIAFNTDMEMEPEPEEDELMPSPFTEQSVSPFGRVGSRVFKWDEMDGLAGSSLRGPRPFDSMEVRWVYHF